MDCRTALERLEVVSLNATGRPEDAELAEAVEHVESCPRCAPLAEQRRAGDARIGRAMRDVPVPAELPARLLAALNVPEQAVSPAANAVPPNRTRRMWLRWVSAAAAMLVLAVLAWQFRPQEGVRLTSADLAALASTDLESLGDFTGDFTPELPAGWPPVSGQFAVAGPKGLPLAESSSRQAAVYTFQLRRRTGRVAGMLLAIPKSQIAKPPADTQLSLNDVRYSGGFAWTQWSSDRFVYVCYVRGGAANLEQLHHWLQESSPLS